MGKFTGEEVATIRATGRGSDYFGNCDECGKHASEVYVHQQHRVYVKEGGLRYLSPIGGGTHGHNGCLTARYGYAVDKANLARIGNLTLAPV